MAALLNSSTLNHPVSSVMRQYLLDVSIGVSHLFYDESLPIKGTLSNWGVYQVNLPSRPDNLIVVMDQEGEAFARLQESGRKVVHHGIQILVRCEHYVVGFRKANQIFTNLTETPFVPLDVTIGDTDLDYTTYAISAIRATSPVVSLGQERDADSTNYLFSINFLVVLKQYDRLEQGQYFQQEE